MSAERPPEGAMDELGAAIEVSEARSGLAVLRNAVAMLGSDSAYAGVYERLSAYLKRREAMEDPPTDHDG